MWHFQARYLSKTTLSSFLELTFSNYFLYLFASEIDIHVAGSFCLFFISNAHGALQEHYYNFVTVSRNVILFTHLSVKGIQLKRLCVLIKQGRIKVMTKVNILIDRNCQMTDEELKLFFWKLVRIKIKNIYISPE